MNVHVGPRDDGSTSLVQIRHIVLVMEQYGQQQQQDEGDGKERKLVVAIPLKSTFVDFLRVLSAYAAVDTLTLLPILILVNTVSLWMTLCEFGGGMWQK
jgi:hypothetical protein